MRKIHRMILLLLSLLLAVSLAVPAWAAEGIDMSRLGSITVTLKLPGGLDSYGTLTLYRVADIVYDHVDDPDVRGDERGYQFVPVSALKVSDGFFRNLDKTDLPEETAKQVLRAEKENRMDSYDSVVIKYNPHSKRAEAKFRDLELGLYLAVQKTPADGYYELSPFLISVPYASDGKYVYDVTAAAKSELKKVPEEIPTPPSIPQTGQLNWPVPTLAAAGILLVAIGWVLRNRKQEENA